MNIKRLVKKTRSYRRFKENIPISIEFLEDLLDTARLCSSARNDQPLRYMLSTNQKTNTDIFSTLSWAGDLNNWEGPKIGERPSAYIVMLADMGLNNWMLYDAGIASQTILLQAASKGIGCCILGSVKKYEHELRVMLKIPNDYHLLSVIALGKPSEKVVIEPMVKKNKSYYRDNQDIHHVPKRALDDIIIAKYA